MTAPQLTFWDHQDLRPLDKLIDNLLEMYPTVWVREHPLSLNLTRVNNTRGYVLAAICDMIVERHEGLFDRTDEQDCCDYIAESLAQFDGKATDLSHVPFIAPFVEMLR